MNNLNRNDNERGIPPAPPTPEQVKALRTAAGLTQTEAAALVYVSPRAWQRWEQNEDGKNARVMHASTWELFIIKLAANEKKIPRKYRRHIIDDLKIFLPEDAP